MKPGVRRNGQRRGPFLSLRQPGIDGIEQVIDTRLGRNDEIVVLVIPAHEGRLVNWLYEEAQVLERESLDSGAVRARVRIAGEKKERLLVQVRRAGAQLKGLVPANA